MIGGVRAGDDIGRGLLADAHGEQCGGGTVYSACRPLVLPAGHPLDDPHDGHGIVGVYMTWCRDCGAAAWEVIQ